MIQWFKPETLLKRGSIFSMNFARILFWYLENLAFKL